MNLSKNENKMFEKFYNLIKNNNFEDIYLVGIFDDDEERFVINNNFIYLEFESAFLELEAIKSYSKISIRIVDSIKPEIMFTDVKPCKGNIGDIIFVNSLAINKIKGIYLYDLEKKKDEIITDALFIRLANGQEIFVDPGFLGFTLGGVEQKKFWEENLIYVNREIPKESYIEFK